MKPEPSPPRADSARSPFAGCLILIIAMAVMLFLIGFSTLTLFRQADAIAAFTHDKPAPIEATSLEDREADLNLLAERLETFRQKLGGEEPASISLSADDLNLAIAAYDPFQDLRGNFRVQEVTGDLLRIAISFRLNGKPRLTRNGESGWITSDPRYLNATMEARPALTEKEIALRIESLDVPGKEVPVEFVEQMSPYRITERYLADPVLGPAMGKLTRVEVEDGRLVLTRMPGETPVHTITDAEVDSASSRFFVALGIAASAFLLFVAVILYIGLRAKAKAP